MNLPSYPVSGEPIYASWGKQIIDYLRSITPRSSAKVLCQTTANGTTFALRPNGNGSVNIASSQLIYAKPFDLADIGDASYSILDNKAKSGGLWVDAVKQTVIDVDGLNWSVDRWERTGVTADECIYLLRDHDVNKTTITASAILPNGELDGNARKEIIPLWYIPWQDPEDEEEDGSINVSGIIDLRDAYRLITLRELDVCDNGVHKKMIGPCGEPY